MSTQLAPRISITATTTGGAAVAGLVGAGRRIVAAVIARHDAYVRREIAEQHERLERHREVGGDFSVLP
jgi:hypothetical protein